MLSRSGAHIFIFLLAAARASTNSTVSFCLCLSAEWFLLLFTYSLRLLGRLLSSMNTNRTLSTPKYPLFSWLLYFVLTIGIVHVTHFYCISCATARSYLKERSFSLPWGSRLDYQHLSNPNRETCTSTFSNIWHWLLMHYVSPQPQSKMYFYHHHYPAARISKHLSCG